MPVEILKVIAMTSMFMDHIGFIGVFGEYSIYLRAFGRIAFPIYAFLVGTNYVLSSHKRDYAKAIFGFACISEVPFILLTGSFAHRNVLWTFFMATQVLRYVTKVKESREWTAPLAIGLGCVAAELLNTDYGGKGVFLVVVFGLLEFFLGEEKKKFDGDEQMYTFVIHITITILQFCLFSDPIYAELFWRIMNIRYFCALSIFPIVFYICAGRKKTLRGELEDKFKCFSYWFYPIHMMSLVLLSLLA